MGRGEILTALYSDVAFDAACKAAAGSHYQDVKHDVLLMLSDSQQARVALENGYLTAYACKTVYNSINNPKSQVFKSYFTSEAILFDVEYSTEPLNDKGKRIIDKIRNDVNSQEHFYAARLFVCSQYMTYRQIAESAGLTTKEGKPAISNVKKAVQEYKKELKKYAKKLQ